MTKNAWRTATIAVAAGLAMGAVTTVLIGSYDWPALWKLSIALAPPTLMWVATSDEGVPRRLLMVPLHPVVLVIGAWVLAAASALYASQTRISSAMGMVIGALITAVAALGASILTSRITLKGELRLLRARFDEETKAREELEKRMNWLTTVRALVIMLSACNGGILAPRPGYVDAETWGLAVSQLINEERITSDRRVIGVDPARVISGGV